jgi:hypothetical protein
MSDNSSNDIKDEANPSVQAGSKGAASKSSKKEIPQGISYVNTPILLRKLLDKIISAQQPERITQNYLGTVWGFTGGSATALPPFLKKIGFLQPDGTPTEIYSKFRTETGRSAAARQALHNGFPEIFKQNEHAEFADEKALTDIVVHVTGRERSDAVLRSIIASFRTLAGFIDPNVRLESNSNPKPQAPVVEVEREQKPDSAKLGLSYNINIVLPETLNIEVLNAIFRSLKENLLR